MKENQNIGGMRIKLSTFCQFPNPIDHELAPVE